MATNNSNVVPFSVIGPVSGKDISDRIILKDIISEGTSVPYFRSNGNDTFEVVNAETTQTVTNTTFKLEVEDLGVKYQLEAKTSMTIGAVTGGTFKVAIVAGGIIGKQGQVTSIDFIPTWRGQPLGLADAKFVIAGLEGLVTINREELLPDGITHRVYLNIVSTGVWSNYYTVRVERTAGVKTVLNDGYVSPTVLIMVYQAAAPLVITSPYYYTDNILTAAIGDVVRVYPKVWYNGVSIPLNTSGLSIVKQNKSGDTGNDVLRIDAITADYIQMTVVGPVSATLKTFTWTYSYTGYTKDVGGGITVPTATKSTIPMAFQNTLVANDTQKSIFNAVKPTLGWTPYWSVDGAVFESGIAEFIDKATGLRIGGVVDLTGLAADQINRFIKSVTPSWQAQELRISGILGVIRAIVATSSQRQGRNPVPIVVTSLAIPAAPYTPTVKTSLIDQTLNAPTAVIAAIVQVRNGVPTNVNGALSSVTVSGAATYVSSSTSTDGSLIINVRGTGSPGEVSISGTVTENSVAYPFTFGLSAGTVGVTSTPSVINTKVWETGTTLPFVVKDGVTDVTNQITDVKLIPTSYIGVGPNGVGWEVLNADKTATTVSVQYTFKYNGLTYSATGQFGLAAWDGIVVSVTGTPTQLGATIGQDLDYVVNVTYKGKPGADKVTLASLPFVGTRITIMGQRASEDNTQLIFTVRGLGAAGFAAGGNAIYKVKDTPGTTVNVDLVNAPITTMFFHLDQLYMYDSNFIATGKHRDIVSISSPGTIWKAGRLLKWSDPDLQLIVNPGTTATPTLSAKWVASTDTGPLFDIITSNGTGSLKTYNNLLTVRLKSDITKYVLSGLNFLVGVNPGTGVMFTINSTSTLTQLTDNNFDFTVAQTTDTLEYTGVNFDLSTISITPNTGNALTGLTFNVTENTPGKYRFIAKSGYTGKSFTISGYIKYSNKLYPLVDKNVVVPQSPLVPNLVNNIFNSNLNETTVVKFKLNQKRFEETPVAILTASLSGNMTSSGNGTPSSFKTNVVDGNFEFTMTGIGVEGDSTVSMTLIVDGITYPVILTLVALATVDNATVVFNPGTVSGLYNESLTTSLVMTKNGGGVVDLTGARVSVSPTGIVTPVSIGPDGFVFTLSKNSENTSTDSINVVVISATGDQATSSIEVTTLNNKLWATPEATTTGNAGVKDLYFTLKDAKGQLATDVTLVSIAASVTDFNSVYDFNTSSNFFKDAGTPGRYYVRATINWKDDTLKVTSTVKQGTVNRVVEGLSWAIPLSAITVEVTPPSVIKENPDYTPVVIKYIQQRWNGALVNTEIAGTVTGVVVTGTGQLENGEIVSSGGVFSAKVKSSGVAGSINISGVLNATNPAYNMGIVSFDILSITNPMVLTVDPDHGEGFPNDALSFNYLLTNAGEEVDTTGSSMTLTPGSAFGSYSLDTANKKVGFRIIKAAQPDSEIIVTNLTLSKSGPLVKAPITVTIYGYKVTLTTVSNKTLNPGVTNTILFDLKDTAGKPAVDATFSTVTCNSAGDSITVPQPAEVVAVSGTPGRYSFNLRANNPEGYGEVSFIATYKGGTTLLVGSELTFINPGVVVPELTVQSPTTISGQSGKTVLMNVTVRDGGNVVATDNSANSFVSDNPEIAIIDGLTSSQLRLKLVYNPTAAEESKEINFTLTNNGRTTKFKTTAFISKAAEPVMVVTPIAQSGVIWESSYIAPFTVTVDGVDKTTDITNLVIEPNDYITLDDGRGWYIANADSTEHIENVVYTFDLEIDGVTKSGTVTVPFTIAAWDGVVIKGRSTPDSITDVVNSTGILKVEVVKEGQDATPAAGIYSETVMLDFITLGDAVYEDSYLNIPWTATSAGNETLQLKINVFGGTGVNDIVTIPVAFNISQTYVINNEVETTGELEPFVRTQLYFNLTDGEGAVITDATKVDLKLVTNPRSGSVVTSYGGGIYNDPDVPGRYFIVVTPGETTGTITVTLTLAVPDKTDSYVLPDMIWTNKGTAVVATPTPNKVAPVLNEITSVDFTLTKGISSDPLAPAIGTVRVTDITGPASLGTQVTTTATPGTYNFGIKSTGVAGKVVVSGTYNNDSTASIFPNVPFSFEFEYINDEPVVTGPEEPITLALWETKVLSYDVMAGEDNINDTVTDVVITNQVDVADWIELVKDAEGVYSLKAIKADKVNNTNQYPNIAVKGIYLGNPYTANFIAEVIISANTTNIPVNRFNVEFL